MIFWRRKQLSRDKIAKDLKSVTEIAGDQLSPGVGTFALVLGGLAVAGAAAYLVHQRRKNKKAASDEAALSKPDKSKS
jgi:hypothetical protein